MLDPSPALGGMSFRLRRFQMLMEGAEEWLQPTIASCEGLDLVQLPTSDLWRALYYLRCGLVCIKVYIYSLQIIYVSYQTHGRHIYIYIYLTRQAGYLPILNSGQAGHQSANEANRGRSSSVRGLVCVCVGARAYTTTAATLEPTVLCRAASANKHGTHLSTLLARPPPHTDQLLPPQLHGAQCPVPPRCA